MSISLSATKSRIAEAAERLQVLRTEARAAGDLQSLSFLSLELGHLCIVEDAGDARETEIMLQEALDLGARGFGGAVAGRALLSVRRARMGETHTARQLLEDAHEQAVGRGGVRAWEIWLWWAEGNVDRKWINIELDPEAIGQEITPFNEPTGDPTLMVFISGGKTRQNNQDDPHRSPRV